MYGYGNNNTQWGFEIGRNSSVGLQRSACDVLAITAHISIPGGLNESCDWFVIGVGSACGSVSICT